MSLNPRRIPRTRSLIRLVVALLLAISTLGVIGTPRATHAAGGGALILGSSVSGGTGSREAAAAAMAGLAVTIVTDAQWAAMTTAQFAAFDEIIVGDPTCSSISPVVAANATVWGAAVNGNIIVIGTDPVFHATFNSPPQSTGAATLINNGIAFAASSSAKTGLYLDLTCAYSGSPPDTLVPEMDGISPPGSNTVHGPACGTSVHIVASHPALAGLTDTNLGDWGCSDHEAFDHFDPTFTPLVIAEDGGSFVASDGTTGSPYILVRGAGVTVVGNIHLAPASQTVPVGTNATVTATVTDGSPPVPVAGDTVTFTVLAGPNVGKTGAGVTDASGNATFTYTSAVAGTDTVQASFVDSSGHTESSEKVAIIWTPATTDTTPPSCALTGVIAGPPKQIQITVQDSDGGLKSVVVTESNNATMNVPTFTPGATVPVIVTATKIDQTLGAQVALQVTDMAGNVTNCDPVLSDIIRDEHQPSTVTAYNIAQSEHLVHIYNDVPGLTHLTIRVNGVRMLERDLEPGEVRVVDISAALQPGTNNRVTLVARGKQRGDATFVIADS
ncbi:MAG TPA: Ig-like domain-containing protein [Chloroflexota bacterium]|nr:Ig-like domain-containing protein [Chloroflexota bacterium]